MPPALFTSAAVVNTNRSVVRAVLIAVDSACAHQLPQKSDTVDTGGAEGSGQEIVGEIVKCSSDPAQQLSFHAAPMACSGTTAIFGTVVAGSPLFTAECSLELHAVMASKFADVVLAQACSSLECAGGQSHSHLLTPAADALIESVEEANAPATAGGVPQLPPIVATEIANLELAKQRAGVAVVMAEKQKATADGDLEATRAEAVYAMAQFKRVQGAAVEGTETERSSQVVLYSHSLHRLVTSLDFSDSQ